jgi:RNA methyltransferase, TrmH family
MPEFISSHANPLVKQVRSLHQKKNRQETGLFLVEGIHHVGEAIQAGWNLDTLLYAPDQLDSDFGLRLVNDLSARGAHCIALASDLFTSLAEKDNPQGLIGVFHQRRLPLESADPGRLTLAAALVSPQDPGNVGTILRTLDAVGGSGLFLLDGGVELYNPSVVRASMGTLFWQPVFQSSFADFVLWVVSNNIRLIGSSAHAKVDYRESHLDSRPTILLLGSEQKGLSADQLNACELNVSMPMKGRASSLNLAVAAGILLFHLMESK